MKNDKIVYLHTGTNQGNRQENLLKVNDLIQQHIGKIITESSIYETAAWGLTNQPDFYNQALKVATILSPKEILEKIAFIETSTFNRVREQKWASRIIDIDILFYENEIINTDTLIIPHQHLHQRNFVLIPLMEIAADYMHPVLEETIEDLYWKSEDDLDVILVED
jgi:2-amino-4-hydroxy-6-hydroxymethyldihydropteridine diphosphokinase